MPPKTAPRRRPRRSTNSRPSPSTFEAPMTSLAELLAQGAGHAWLFIPSALLLGALHGLEPGHSKTMMAAFIVAVRGTVWQAILLGLSATASHTLIVWIIGLAGLYFGRNLNLDTAEPWFQLASAGG